jgi:hypothetical protein
MGFWTLSIVRNSKNYKTQYFGKWICFRPQAKWRRLLVYWVSYKELTSSFQNSGRWTKSTTASNSDSTLSVQRLTVSSGTQLETASRYIEDNENQLHISCVLFGIGLKLRHPVIVFCAEATANYHTLFQSYERQCEGKKKIFISCTASTPAAARSASHPISTRADFPGGKAAVAWS